MRIRSKLLTSSNKIDSLPYQVSEARGRKPEAKKNLLSVFRQENLPHPYLGTL